MTPKEKAIELRDKYYQASLCTIAGTATIFYQNSKNLASLAVDEIISAIEVSQNVPDYVYKDSMWYQYWQKVKEEIKTL